MATSVLAGIAQALELEAYVGVAASVIAVLSAIPVLRRELVMPRRLRRAKQATRPVYRLLESSGDPRRRHEATATQIGAGLWVVPSFLFYGTRGGVEATRLEVGLPDEIFLPLELAYLGPEHNLAVLHSERAWPFSVRPDWDPPEGGDPAVVCGWPVQREAALFPISARGVFEPAESSHLVAYVGTGTPQGMAGGPMVVEDTGRAVAILTLRQNVNGGSALVISTGFGVRLSEIPPAHRSAPARRSRQAARHPTGGGINTTDSGVG
ncbi:hypothetical protein ACFUMJ_18165 [Streptomyces olivaceus]|uniref:trypsin-like peptidase domain-containing protein n=1 Tax=Streptomyces TaxID=1883 RepID=UPI0018A82E31|nr:MULTISPECIES: trypsin-like peptidase domain-containing protein [Streptomyces]MBF8173058.1 trypsin-like peptidase domain-containing protein [Streptomyces olivaceus]UOG83901.1 hypothetical protein L6J92_34165 [Streptomyces sp. CB09030]